MTADTGLGDRLPVDDALPELVRLLREHRSLVLTAPPGAGKTTRVPPALLRAGLVGTRQIVLLQPRRLAARAVARQMARVAGEPLGQTVGYRVRFDRREGPGTRILVLTEGILTRWLLADPVLSGVGCVILDELHERSVHTDLALAFLRELQELREDLRLLVMSATLDAGPVSAYLGGCPHLDLEPRAHPVDLRHAAGGSRQPLARRIRAAVAGLLRDPQDDGGDVLVFLPGAGEIRRAQQELEQQPLPGQPRLVPLYGALPADQQDQALRPGSRRRVILATNIAETSLTVPGVTAVVDSGLVKLLRHDPRVGLDRLETTHASRSSAGQRAGRAGRTAPGRAVRLWTAADHAALPAHHPPELLRVDLAPVLLAVLSFHPGDPRRFPFLDSPGEAPLAAALSFLRMLGAVREHRLTDRGQRLAALPVHPRVGVMLEAGAAAGLTADAALLAALLGERDLLPRLPPGQAQVPTSESDLLWRRELFLEWERQGACSRAARALGLDPGAAFQVRRARDQLLRLARRGHRAADRAPPEGDLDRALGQLLLTGYPDRVCRRRAVGEPTALMVGGRGVRLAPESGVREAELFVALQAEAGPRGLHATSLVRLASAVTQRDLRRVFPDLLQQRQELAFDDQRAQVVARRQTCFSDLVLEQQESPPEDAGAAAALLASAAAERFERIFRPDPDARQLLARLRLAAEHLPRQDWPDVTPAGLRALLPELCHGRRGLADLERLDWAAELGSRLSYQQRALLDRELPWRLAVPSGRQARLDYAAAAESGGLPVLAVKLQELFGLAETPRLARGRLPLLLHLLAPSGRPVQVTSDLRSFWDRGYPEVRRDLRGRYPKHPWPEDPWSARPTARTKQKPKTT